MLPVHTGVAMQAVELLPSGAALPGEVVERWVSAALSEAAALRDLDDQLYPDVDDPDRLDRARKLHATWRHWADQAGALLRRVLADDPSVRTRHDIVQLRQEVGWARALVEQPPEMILQRLKEAMDGDVMTLEEVRRELRARHQP
jgi:hypothetical protein